MKIKTNKIKHMMRINVILPIKHKLLRLQIYNNNSNNNNMFSKISQVRFEEDKIYVDLITTQCRLLRLQKENYWEKKKEKQ